MIVRRGGAVLLLCVGLAVLAGCESSKDKAARHLASALELVEQGDAERALVEFRNVFTLDPDNRDALANQNCVDNAQGDAFLLFYTPEIVMR